MSTLQVTDINGTVWNYEDVIEWETRNGELHITLENEGEVYAPGYWTNVNEFLDIPEWQENRVNN